MSRASVLGAVGNTTIAELSTIDHSVLVDYARQHQASKRGAACTIALEDGGSIALVSAPDSTSWRWNSVLDLRQVRA